MMDVDERNSIDWKKLQERIIDRTHRRQRSLMLSLFVASKAFTVNETYSSLDEKTLDSGQSSYVPRFRLEVTPEDNIPVRTLFFNGISRVQRGEKILAMIPRHTGKIAVGNREEDEYCDRDFREEESAIFLALYNNGQSSRRDYSLEFPNYFPEQFQRIFK